MSSFATDRSVVGHRLAPGTFRRIVGYAKPHRASLTVFLLLVLINTLAGAAQPLLYKAVIDEGILQSRADLVIWFAALMGVLAVIGSVTALAQRFFAAKIGQGLVHDLRTQVFTHVQRQPIAFFGRTQTGALVSRLNSDVQGAQRALTSTLSTVVGSVATIVIVLGAMLALAWKMTLIAVAIVPLFVLPARFVGRKLAELTRTRYGLNADMGHTMTERFNVAGATLVKTFGRAESENAEFAVRAIRLRDLGVKTAVYAGVVAASLGLLSALATATIYGIGGVMVIAGSLGIGTVVALTAYLARLYGPIISLSNMQVDVMTALVSFERVFEVLDLEPAIQEIRVRRPLPADAASVEFDHVSFSHPTAGISLASLESVMARSESQSRQVLHDISFRVQPGQMVGVVGHSGAGKTTITQLVSRLHDVTNGTVRVGGVDVREVSLASLHAAVGVVTQDAYLFHTTLRANLAYAKPDVAETDMWEALRAAQISEPVAALPEGLDTVVGDKGCLLSGGERQRIAIARMLLKAPRIVVLDEATAHLDSESEAAIQRALDTVLRGRTSIVIAHRLSSIRHADQILVIDNGRIVERGRHEDLLALGGVYAA